MAAVAAALGELKIAISDGGVGRCLQICDANPECSAIVVSFGDSRSTVSIAGGAGGVASFAQKNEKSGSRHCIAGPCEDPDGDSQIPDRLHGFPAAFAEQAEKRSEYVEHTAVYCTFRTGSKCKELYDRRALSSVPPHTSAQVDQVQTFFRAPDAIDIDESLSGDGGAAFYADPITSGAATVHGAYENEHYESYYSRITGWRCRDSPLLNEAADWEGWEREKDVENEHILEVRFDIVDVSRETTQSGNIPAYQKCLRLC